MGGLKGGGVHTVRPPIQLCPLPFPCILQGKQGYISMLGTLPSELLREPVLSGAEGTLARPVLDMQPPAATRTRRSVASTIPSRERSSRIEGSGKKVTAQVVSATDPPE